MKWAGAFLQLAFFFGLFDSFAFARTRAPQFGNEQALLYWRYLCENQPQSEQIKVRGNSIATVELSCFSQHWKVRAEGDQVKEVVEDGKK